MRHSKKDTYNKNNITKKRKTNGAANRQKGHSYERTLAKLFREEFGFNHCKSSRAASRLLDDCKIDLAFTGNYAVQAKSGYRLARPKPDEIFGEMKALITKNFPADSPEQSLIPMLFHRLDKNNEFVIMRLENFKPIFKNHLNMEKINKNFETLNHEHNRTKVE